MLLSLCHSSLSREAPPAPSGRGAASIFRSGQALTDLCVRDPAAVCACCSFLPGWLRAGRCLQGAFWGSRDLCGIRDKQPSLFVTSKKLLLMGKPEYEEWTASWRDLDYLQELWSKCHTHGRAREVLVDFAPPQRCPQPPLYLCPQRRCRAGRDLLQSVTFQIFSPPPISATPRLCSDSNYSPHVHIAHTSLEQSRINGQVH